jgi:hypothetical protein
LKLPPKVRIKSKVSYEIVYSDLISDCDKTLGECRPVEKQIVIKSGLSDTETVKTFIHEVFHAMDFEYGLELKHKSVHALEEAILKLLKLNKWM